MAQVGADLGRTGYLPEVARATADIDVQVVFCNAGYMLTGFFETKCVWCPCRGFLSAAASAIQALCASCRSLEDQLANLECNATSAVSITHHFLKQMVCLAACGS